MMRKNQIQTEMTNRMENRDNDWLKTFESQGYTKDLSDDSDEVDDLKVYFSK